MKDLLLGVALALIVGSAASPKKLSEAIKKNLQRVLGNEAKVEVKIEKTSTLGFLGGHIGTIRIDIANAPIDKLPLQRFGEKARKYVPTGAVDKIVIRLEKARLVQIPVDELNLEVPKICYNLFAALFDKKLEILNLGESRGTLKISEDSLNAYIQSRITAFDDLKLQLISDKLILEGKWKLLFIPVPVKIEGGLEVVEETKIALAHPKIEVTAIPLPELVTKSILSKLNPIFDLSKLEALPISLKIETLKIEPGFLYIAGKISF